jgi:large-conductance mechanosensitive channel
VSWPTTVRDNDLVQFNPKGDTLDYEIGVVTGIGSAGTVVVEPFNPKIESPIVRTTEDRVTKIGRLKWAPVEIETFDPEQTPFRTDWREVTP